MSLKSFLRRAAVSALIPLSLFAGSLEKARATETIKLVSTEIKYTKDRDVIRFRPFISTEPVGEQRTDLMFGRNFGKLTPYFYFKADNKDRSWAGIRLDYYIRALDDKLTINPQLRYFWGLNDNSKNHFFFIPSVDYELNERFKVGMVGYAKKDDGEKPFFYLGPSVTFNLTDRLSAFLSYDKDVLGNQDADMIFMSLQYDF